MRQSENKTICILVLTFLSAVSIIFISSVFADDAGFAPCPLAGTGSSITAPDNSIVLRVISARTQKEIDSDIWPFVDRAEVYGEIVIDGEAFSLPLVDGNDKPHWEPAQGSFRKIASANPVPIQIRLFDDDGVLSGGRDVIDINPDPSKSALDLTFDLCSFRIGGDIDAAGQSIIMLQGDAGSGSGQGQIVFKIEKENGRPESTGDIGLVGVDLVQVIHESPTMIAGKHAIVMVQLANNFTGPVSTNIELHIFGGDAGTIVHDFLPIVPPLEPNEVRKIYFYKDSPLTIPPPGSSGQGLTIFARLDPDRIHNKGLPTTDCRVINDSLGTDAKDGITRTIARTENLDLLWCKTGTFRDVASLVGDTQFNNMKNLGTAFIKGTYPAANTASTSMVVSCIPPATGTVYSWLSVFLAEIGIPLEWAEPFVMLFELNGFAAITGFTGPEERLIGVLPPNFFNRYYSSIYDENPWASTNGVSLGEAATRAVLVLPVQPDPIESEPDRLSLAVPAHELGHGFGLSVDTRLKNWTCGIDEFIFQLICGASGGLDEYKHDDLAHAKGNPSTGFWIPQGGEPPEVMVAGMVGFEQCDSHCFMGHSQANMENHWNTRRRWIDSADYEHLIGKLLISSSLPAGVTVRSAGAVSALMDPINVKTEGVIYLSGMIDINDRIFLGPWYRLPDQIKADRNPGDEGFYLVRFLDLIGNVLQEVSIPISWPISDVEFEFPVTMFGVTMPYPAFTDTIQIWNPYNQLLLADKKISPRPPYIKFKFNNKRYGRVRQGATIPLKWKAKDYDKKASDNQKGSLEHHVLLSSDGKQWMPAAYRLTKPGYDLSTENLQQGTYYLKIAVSDGVNIGYSEIAQFSVN